MKIPTNEELRQQLKDMGALSDTWDCKAWTFPPLYNYLLDTLKANQPEQDEDEGDSNYGHEVCPCCGGWLT